MAFNNYQVEEDEIACNEADPLLKKLSRKASSIIQDLKMHTYWGNTVGKTKMPGVYELHKQELKENMTRMMYGTKMPYRELEDILVDYGYETGDIREMFKEATGIDPVKLELLRHEDMRAVPANIPCYNLGWGLGKKGETSFFIMTNAHGLYTVYQQLSDLERKEESSFLRHDEAIAHLAKHVKQVHCFDKSALEQVEYLKKSEQKLATDREVKAGATREGFINVFAANEDDVRALSSVVDTAKLEALVSKALPGNEVAMKMVSDLKEGFVTPAQALTVIERTLIDSISPSEEIPLGAPKSDLYSFLKRYAADDKQEDVASPGHTEEGPGQDKGSPELAAEQDKKVVDEVNRKTPQDFFKSSLPNRIDETAPEHIKNVLVYINNRNTDLGEFEVAIRKFEYQRHDDDKTLVTLHPQTGKPTGATKVTISALLEIKDNTIPEGHNKKFALAVFFVGPDGEITTSDSVKGEDEIIYGFTDAGLAQYFAKNRSSKAEEAGI